MNSQAEEVIILDIIIANWGSLYFTSGVLHVEEAKFLWQLSVCTQLYDYICCVSVYLWYLHL